MSLWTVQQHEWLRALGHPVLLLAGDPALTVSPRRSMNLATPVAGADSPASAGRKRVIAGDSAAPLVVPRPSDSDDRRGSPAARRAPPPESSLALSPSSLDVGAGPAGSPRTDASVKKAALEAARGARRGVQSGPMLLPTDDPLLQAIACASGLDASAFEAAARLWQIDLARLRAEPLSKRALWQQMRRKGRNTAR